MSDEDDLNRRLRMALPPELLQAMRDFAPKLARYRKGIESSDPKKRAAWRSIAHDTPRKADPIIDYLPNPQGRGHPKGANLEAADVPLVAELRRRTEAGEKKEPVSRELAVRAAGGGTLESKAARLRGRLREKK